MAPILLAHAKKARPGHVSPGRGVDTQELGICAVIMGVEAL